MVRLRVLYMCRKFMPKVMVGQYEQQLRQLTTTLSDYRGKRKYPNSWPASLSAYEIVIETSVYRCIVLNVAYAHAAIYLSECVSDNLLTVKRVL